MRPQNKFDALALKAFDQSVSSSTKTYNLNNLLTPKEKVIVGRRILIAQAILAGKTRHEINNHLSVSPNTFTQIRRWLESEFEEYSSAYKTKPKHTQSTKEIVEPFSYKDLKQKYPAHFLLLSLVEELFTIKK